MRYLILGLAWRFVPIGFALFGCTPETARPARVISYGFELEECTRKADTCQQSIACENEVRTRYSRPLRDASKGCQ
jgi:hypothetical protein